MRCIDFAVVCNRDRIAWNAQNPAHHVVLVPHDSPDKVSICNFFSAAWKLAHPQNAVLLEFWIERIVQDSDGFHDVVAYCNHGGEYNTEDKDEKEHVRPGMASLQ